MPFSRMVTTQRELDNTEVEFIYSEFIKKAVSEYVLENEPVFAEISRYDSNFGSIVDGIVNSLNAADLVIADLTGLNPNVMYELGVRHTLKRGTIVITQEIEKLPSDLRDYMCIEYKYASTNVEQRKNYNSFVALLHKAIQEVFATSKADSPVIKYLEGKQTFWAQDELKKLKENILISSYLVEQYDEIKELLQEIESSVDQNYVKLKFAICTGLINNLSYALADLNIPVESLEVYENLVAAKQLILEIQKKQHYVEYLSTVSEKLDESQQSVFAQLKDGFFNERYVDYFEITVGEYQEITLKEIFSDDGNFYSLFLEDLSEYLQKKSNELGLSNETIESMLN